MNAPIVSMEEFLVHVIAMEEEAVERYTELADEMDLHNNPEVAALFRQMAEIEGKHSAKAESLAEGCELPHIAPWDMRWETPESPEAPEVDEMHYLMRPYHALSIALRAERNAQAFLTRVVKTSAETAVRELASQLAEEEGQHVRWMEEWLARYREPGAGWDEDLDPPMSQE